MQALGLTGVDKSKVSRICKELDEAVTAFRNRPLEADYPYLWLDALYVKVRQNHRIVSMAVVIAIGVRETGERAILAVDIGASEDEAFWKAFLRGLTSRGLKGAALVISDAREGLKQAVNTVLTGAAWQRCRVHFMRNVLAHVQSRQVDRRRRHSHHLRLAYQRGSSAAELPGAGLSPAHDVSPSNIPGIVPQKKSFLDLGPRTGFTGLALGHSPT